MNFETIESLSRLLAEIDRDERISKIVLYGEGNNFCSGFDLNEVKAQNRDKLVELIRSNGDWFRSSKLTIAFVQGYAVGLGFELAVACDVLIADESCRFGFLNRRLGLPTFLPLARLRNLIGRLSTIELLDDAHLIRSREALSLGLIKHLLRDDPEESGLDEESDFEEASSKDLDDKNERNPNEDGLNNLNESNLNANSLQEHHLSRPTEEKNLANRPSQFSLDRLDSLLESIQVDRKRLEIERSELNRPFRLERTNEDRLPDEWASHDLDAANYNRNSRHGKYDLSFWNEIQGKFSNN